MVTLRASPFVRVNQDDSYNAFTTLTYHGGHYWIAYRTASRHVSPDGKIVLCRSQSTSDWERVAVIEQPGADLRDPRLLSAGETLYLMAFSLVYPGKAKSRHLPGDTYFYSFDEKGRPSLEQVAGYDKNGIKFWDLKKCGRYFYATGYSMKLGHFRGWLLRAERIGAQWDRVSAIPDQMVPPNVGINEVEIAILPGKEFLLFCRVDYDRRTWLLPGESKKDFKWAQAQRQGSRNVPFQKGLCDWLVVARALPRYTSWATKVHRHWMKGPRAIMWEHTPLFFCRWPRKKSRKREVAAFQYSGDFQHLHTLATGRDGSYVGLCWDPENPAELVVSLYSDHARRRTPLWRKANDIWVTRLRFPDFRTP